MDTDLSTNNSDRAQAIAWLREGLTAMLVVCPLSYHQKKKASRFLDRMPDWLMASWADALNIDYVGGYKQFSDFPERAKTETGRQLAQQYLEAHNVVATGNCLEQLSRSVFNRVRGGGLPIDSQMVERQVCALAWAECTQEGTEFAGKAREILNDSENPNHPIVDYQIALERGDKGKLEGLDAILTGGRYGEWVDLRLDEAWRYKGVDYPVFRINFVERTPQWDAFWENIVKGGKSE